MKDWDSVKLKIITGNKVRREMHALADLPVTPQPPMLVHWGFLFILITALVIVIILLVHSNRFTSDTGKGVSITTFPPSLSQSSEEASLASNILTVPASEDTQSFKCTVKKLLYPTGDGECK